MRRGWGDFPATNQPPLVGDPGFLLLRPELSIPGSGIGVEGLNLRGGQRPEDGAIAYGLPPLLPPLPQTCPSPSPALLSLQTESLLAAGVCATGNLSSACSSPQPLGFPACVPPVPFLHRARGQTGEKLNESPKVPQIQPPPPISLTAPLSGCPRRAGGLG